MSDPINDLKHELMAAAERQHRHAVTAGATSGWLGGGARGTRLALSVATLAAAAGAALSSPPPGAVPPTSSPRRRQRSRRRRARRCT